MSELIRRGKLWWPAFFSMARYTVYSGLVAFSAWFESVSDKWNDLTQADMVRAGITVGLAVLTAIGAVMNGSWQEAKRKDVP